MDSPSNSSHLFIIIIDCRHNQTISILTHSTAPIPVLEIGVKKRGSGATLSKPQHLSWGVEGLAFFTFFVSSEPNMVQGDCDFDFLHFLPLHCGERGG